MSSPYKLEKLDNGSGYKFVTSSGNVYTAYFTDFTLLDPSADELSVISFGFYCERFDEGENLRHDSRIKQTIIFIVEAFFNEQPENAVLYICVNSDGKARNRQITFSSWFNQFSKDIEKYDAPQALGDLDFYGALLLRKDNPHKQKMIDAFYFTIDYWGLNS